MLIIQITSVISNSVHSGFMCRRWTMGRGAVISSVMTPRNSPPTHPPLNYMLLKGRDRDCGVCIYEWDELYTWPNTIHSHTYIWGKISCSWRAGLTFNPLSYVHMSQTSCNKRQNIDPLKIWVFSGSILVWTCTTTWDRSHRRFEKNMLNLIVILSTCLQAGTSNSETVCLN